MLKLLTLTLLTLLPLTPALAQTDHSHMNHGAPAKSSAGTSADLGSLQGRAFERAFLSMMVPHHEAALEMARAALPRSKDATVQQWANRILVDQQREIGQMKALLKAYGGPDARWAAKMQADMAGMAQKVRRSSTPERTFVADMIPHHGSALEMANLALQKASSPSVLKLARDIAVAQAGEMYAFQRWLGSR